MLTFILIESEWERMRMNGREWNENGMRME